MFSVANKFLCADSPLQWACQPTKPMVGYLLCLFGGQTQILQVGVDEFGTVLGIENTRNRQIEDEGFENSIKMARNCFRIPNVQFLILCGFTEEFGQEKFHAERMSSHFSLDIGPGLFLRQDVVEDDCQKNAVFGKHPDRDVKNPLNFFRCRPFFTVGDLFEHRIEFTGRQSNGVGKNFLFVLKIFVNCRSGNFATVGDFLVCHPAIPFLGEERKGLFKDRNSALLMIDNGCHTVPHSITFSVKNKTWFPRVRRIATVPFPKGGGMRICNPRSPLASFRVVGKGRQSTVGRQRL